MDILKASIGIIGMIIVGGIMIIGSIVLGAFLTFR